jgi:predicted dehydrogenase
MDRIRWGMIGCGSVAEMKSGPAFNKVPHSQLMAVMRRDEALLKEYALRHQVPQTFTNALELIHHPGIDAIYIATPPDVHDMPLKPCAPTNLYTLKNQWLQQF